MKTCFVILLFLGLFAGLPSQLWASQDDLAYYLPPHEYVWLENHENTEQENDQESHRYLMLHRENQLSFLRGTAIIVPDWGFHPIQSTYANMTYQALPRYGWETFALHAPTDSLLNFRWQEENGTPYPTATTEDERAFLYNSMSARVEAAMAHIESEPGFRILVTEGISAAVIVDLLEAGEITGVDALVVIAPNYPQWQLNRELSISIAQLDIPVLDLQPRDAIHWSTEESARRKILAGRYQHTGYRQRGLSSQTNRQNTETFSQLIYGWLTYEGF